MSKLIKGVLYFAAAATVLAVPVFAQTPTPTSHVPEPSTIMMLAGGLGGVVGLRYYKLRKK